MVKSTRSRFRRRGIFGEGIRGGRTVFPAEDMEKPNDEDLVLSLAGGEDAALMPLMERYEGRVRGFLTGRLRWREDVEEATQDVFLKVHRGARTYRVGGRFEPWLFAIARNVARDRLRARRPEALPLDEAWDADLSVYEEEPAVERVRAAVRGLPERYRAALTLKYLAGLSYREAARECGLTEKGFETRLARARSRLRCALTRRKGGDGLPRL